MTFLNDFQNEFDRFRREQNAQGLEEFEWYSPEEMIPILYNPFSPLCSVRLKVMTEQNYQRVPLLNQTRYLLDQIHQKSEVKMTAKGYLPMEIVNDLYRQGFMKEYLLDKFNKNKKLREFDSFSVHMTRLLLDVAGLIKKRKGNLSLTKKGHQLRDDPAGLLFHLLHAVSFSFNWAYFDGYGQNNVGRLGWVFTIILLSKYGREEKTDSYYATKHFAAFPDMIKEVQIPYIRDLQTTAHRCYSHRTFNNFLQYLGVIEITFENYLSDTRNIIATDLLSKMFSIEGPEMITRRN